VAGVLVVAVAAALFGFLGPVTRFTYAAGLAPFAFIAWRSLIGMVGAAGFVVWGRRRDPGGGWNGRQSPRTWAALLMASAASFGVNAGMFIAFQRIPVAMVLLAFYTYPAMVALVAVILGREQMDWMRAIALALASLGAAIVVTSQAGGAGAFDLPGVALALVAAVCQTVFVTVSRDGYRTVPAVPAMAVILAGIASAGIVASLLVEPGDGLLLPLAKPDLLALLIVVGLFTATIPSILLLIGIRQLGGMRAGILMLLEPLVGVILAAVLLAEPLRPAQLAGGLAILGAAVILTRAHRADRRGRPAPAVP